MHGVSGLEVPDGDRDAGWYQRCRIVSDGAGGAGTSPTTNLLITS